MKGVFTQDGGAFIVPAGNNGVFIGHDPQSLLADDEGGYYYLNAGSLSTRILDIGVRGYGYMSMEDGTTVTILNNGGNDRLYVGRDSGSVGVFDINGGTVSAPDGWMRVGNSNGANGTVNQSAGSVRANDISISHENAVGLYNMTGGSIAADVDFYVARRGTGTLNLDGGSITVGDELFAGYFGGSNGTINFDSGSITVSDFIEIGNTGTGTINMTGGTFTVNNFTRFGVNNGSTGTITQTGGVFSVLNGWHILGQNDGSHGTHYLDGGTLNALRCAIGWGNSSGNASTGRIELRDSGMAAILNADTHVALGGSSNTATGYLIMDNPLGQIDIGTDLFIGGYNPGRYGTGFVEVSAGMMSVASSMYVSYFGNGTVDHSGGTINASRIEVGSAGSAYVGNYNFSGDAVLNATTFNVNQQGNFNGSADLPITGADHSFNLKGGNYTLQVGSAMILSAGGQTEDATVRFAAGENAGDKLTIHGDGVSKTDWGTGAIATGPNVTVEGNVKVTGPTHGMTAYFSFDEAGNNIGRDSVFGSVLTGHTANTVDNGSVTQNTADALVGGAASFGSNAWLGSVNVNGDSSVSNDLAKSGELQLPQTINNGAYSISAWVRPSALGTYDGIVTWGWSSNGNNGGSNNYKMVELRVDNGSNTAVRDSWANSNLDTGAGALAVGQWTHILTTYDPTLNVANPGMGRKIYINGVDTSTNYSGTLTEALGANLRDFRLGRAESAEYFNGLFDEVAIFDTAITPADVYGGVEDPITRAEMLAMVPDTAFQRIDGTGTLDLNAMANLAAGELAGSVNLSNVTTSITLGNANVVPAVHTGIITAGAASLAKIGTNTQILAGDSTVGGGLAVTGGVLQIGNDGASGSLRASSAAIGAGATLRISRSDDHLVTDVVNGAISGAGNFEIANTATGMTIFPGDLPAAAALPSGTHVTSGGLQLGYLGAYSGTLDSSLLTLDSGTTLAFDLLAATTAPPAVPFDVNGATLRLRGSGNGYTSDFVRSVATNLDRFTVDPGTSLRVVIDAGLNGGLTAARQITINPSDLIVDMQAMSTANLDQTFDILEIANSASITTHSGAWTTSDLAAINTLTSLDSRYFCRYTLSQGLLQGSLTLASLPADQVGVTNPDALDTIFTEIPKPGSPTETLQKELRALAEAGASAAELDAIVQQFVPSMAAASYSHSTAVNTQILQVVASQITVPWEDRAGSRQFIRGQATLTPATRPLGRPATHSWLQTFGYGGDQAPKDYFAGFDTTGWGFALGADRTLGNRTFGLAYGYTDSRLETQPWLGTEDPNQLNFGTHTFLTYGLSKLTERTFAVGKLGFSLSDTEGFRRPTESLAANWGTLSRTLFLQATLGYQMINTGRLTVTPKFKFGYFNFQQAGYREHWSDGSFAEIARFSDGYCEYNGLLDFDLVLLPGFSVTGSMGYRRVEGAHGAVLGMDFDSLTYSVNGIPAAEDWLICDLGTNILLTERLTLVAEYNLRSGDGYRLQGGTGTFVWEF